MLISDKNKFIFIHVKKNAGTSITSALYPYTANIAVRILERAALKINHLMNKKVLRLSFGVQPYGGHITAQQLINSIGHERFLSYFSFAVVRNPWDWQASLYTYIHKRPEHPWHNMLRSLGSFDAYIRWHCNNIKENTIPEGSGAIFQSECLCSPEGEILVNYVARFENLDSDFRDICDRIGIKTELPRMRVTKSMTHHEFYNDETKNLVATTFRQDIDRFEYSF